MSDDAWKTTFEVKQRSERYEDGDLGSTFIDVYDIINIHSGQTVGTYMDACYAKKQARRKYKKLAKLVEKLFTSKA